MIRKILCLLPILAAVNALLAQTGIQVRGQLTEQSFYRLPL